MEAPNITLTIDATDAIPTLVDLEAYGVAEMRVVTRGPGGGNPEVTLAFSDAGGEGTMNARRFLADWRGSDDVEEDLRLALTAA